MRNSLHLLSKQMEYFFRTPDFWLLVLMVSSFLAEVIKFGGGIPLIYDGSGVFAILGGMLLLSTSFPGMFPGAEFRVMRTSRGAWFFSQLLFAVVMVIAYLLLIFVITTLIGKDTSLATLVEMGEGTLLRGLLFYLVTGLFFLMVCLCSEMWGGGKGIGIFLCGILIFTDLFFLKDDRRIHESIWRDFFTFQIQRQRRICLVLFGGSVVAAVLAYIRIGIYEIKSITKR